MDNVVDISLDLGCSTFNLRSDAGFELHVKGELVGAPVKGSRQGLCLFVLAQTNVARVLLRQSVRQTEDVRAPALTRHLVHERHLLVALVTPHCTHVMVLNLLVPSRGTHVRIESRAPGHLGPGQVREGPRCDGPGAKFVASNKRPPVARRRRRLKRAC